ncbi:MAG: phage replisome organizer N-terminal domain-containing protein [Saccharofermentanales bacterium]
MCNILDHRKIKMIRKGPEGNTLVLLWLLMLAEAGKCNRGGYLMVSDSLPYTAETLSMVTDIALPTVQLGLTIFAGLEMIDQQDGSIFIANWSKYQSEDKLEKRRENDRERKQRHRKKQRDNLLALPEPADVSRDSHVDRSRDVTPESRTEKKIEKITTEHIHSLLSGTPFSVVQDNELVVLIKRHGEKKVELAADIAAVSWRLEHKEIRNPGGYLQSLCVNPVIPELYEPPHVRAAKSEAAAERKRAEDKRMVEHLAAEERETRERDSHWGSLSVEDRQKYRDEARESSPIFQDLKDEHLDGIAKLNAWENRTQMITNTGLTGEPSH